MHNAEQDRGELAGKVAIVTGGASGLGRATVERFVREGARVVIADVDARLGESLAAELGERVRFARTDVSDAAQVQAIVDLAISAFGGLHIMVNNAGITGALFARQLDDDFADFHRVLGVNLLGVMLGTQRAARHMARHGGGSIINTASIGGSVAGFGVTTYRASKAAVIHYSKCAAIDLAEHGIRVNIINPGHIRTPLSSYGDSAMSSEAVRDLQATLDGINMFDQPLKRHGQADDVAEAALYLAGDRSRQITGLVLPVDGGTTVGDSVNHVQQILDARNKALRR